MDYTNSKAGNAGLPADFHARYYSQMHAQNIQKKKKLTKDEKMERNLGCMEAIVGILDAIMEWVNWPNGFPDDKALAKLEASTVKMEQIASTMSSNDDPKEIQKKFKQMGIEMSIEDIEEQ